MTPMSHPMPLRPEHSADVSQLPNSIAQPMQKLREDLGDIIAWEELDEGCRQEDRPDEAASFYGEALGSSLTGDLLAEVGRRAADFCEEWFDETQPVMEMLKKVLAADAGQSWAFERLTVLLTVTSQWTELLKAYDAALSEIPSAEIDRKTALLEEAAKVARDFAGQAQQGTDYLVQLLSIRANDEQLFRDVEKRLSDEGRYQLLIDTWQARVERVEADEALGIYRQMAQVFLRSLNLIPDALASILKYLEIGGQPAAVWELLHELSEHSGTGEAEKLTSLGILEQHYGQENDQERLLGVIQELLRLPASEMRQVQLHNTAADLLERAEQPQEALRELGALMSLGQVDGSLRQRALGLATSVNGVELYRDFILVAADLEQRLINVEQRVELWLEAAQLSEEKLGDGPTAKSLYRAIEELEGATDEAQLLALREQGRLYRISGEPRELISVLSRLAALEESGTQQAALLGEAAGKATEIGDLTRALELWAQRLVQNVGDLVALSAQVELNRQLNDTAGLVKSLLARSAHNSEKSQERIDLVEAAILAGDQLSEFGEALEIWQKVEHEFGPNSETLEARINLSEKAEYFEDVEVLLNESLSLYELNDQKADVLARLGKVQANRLSKGEAAISSFDKALILVPEHALSIQGLQLFLEDASLRGLASAALWTAFEAASADEALLEIAELHVQTLASVQEKERLLLQVAEIQKSREDAPAFLDYLVRAFVLRASPTIEAALKEVTTRQEQSSLMLMAYEKASSLELEEPRLFELLVAKGKLELEMGLDSSVSTLRAAFDLEPKNESVTHEALKSALQFERAQIAAEIFITSSELQSAVSVPLCALYEARLKSPHSAVLLDGLEAVLRQTTNGSGELLHELWKLLGNWFIRGGLENAKAEACLEEAMLAHASKETLIQLIGIQRQNPTLSLVQNLLNLARREGEDLKLLTEAASVCLELQAEDLASQTLEQIFSESKTRLESRAEDGEASESALWATQQLVQLAQSRSDLSAALRQLEATAELPLIARSRVQSLYDAAKIAEDLQDEARAILFCERALSVERSAEIEAVQRSVRLKLGGLLESQGDWDRLLELRRDELSGAESGQSRSEIRLDIARIMGLLDVPALEREGLLKENLAEVPGDSASLSALESLLSATESYDKLCTLFEQQAQQLKVSSRAQAASLYMKAGQWAENFLQDTKRLQRNYEAACQLEPRIELLDRLALLCKENKSWHAVVEFLTKRLELTSVSDKSLEALKARKQVTIDLADALLEIDDLSEARRVLEADLNDEAESLPPRERLLHIYTDLEDWSALSRELMAVAVLKSEASVQADLLKQAAQIAREKLIDYPLAVAALKQATDFCPNDQALKIELADALRVSGELAASKSLLLSLLDDFGRRRTKAKADVFKLLAEIERSSDRLADALAYAESAAAIERTDPETLMLVGQLARQGGQLERAEQSYRTLALVVSRQSGESGKQKIGEAQVMFELHCIAKEKGEAVQAKELMASALSAATRSLNEALLLEETLRRADSVGLLVDALEEQLEKQQEPRSSARLKKSLAVVQFRSGRSDVAFALRLQCLELDPADIGLLDDTLLQAAEIERVPEMLDHLEALAKSQGESPEKAGHLWLRLAKESEALEQLERAASAFESAQRLGIRPKETYLGLERTFNDETPNERRELALTRFVDQVSPVEEPQLVGRAFYSLASLKAMAAQWANVESFLAQGIQLSASQRPVVDLLQRYRNDTDIPSSLLQQLVSAAQHEGDETALLGAYRSLLERDEVDELILNQGIALSRTLQFRDELKLFLSGLIKFCVKNDKREKVHEQLLERQKLAQEDSDFVAAVALLGLALQNKKTDALDLFLLRAELQEKQLNDLNAAAETLNEGLNAYPTEQRFWQRLLDHYRLTGQRQSTLELLERLEAQELPASALQSLRLERIRLAIAAGHTTEAETELRAMIEEGVQAAADVLLLILSQDDARKIEYRDLLEELFDQARNQDNGTLTARYGLALVDVLGEEGRDDALNVLFSGLGQLAKEEKALGVLLSLYTVSDSKSDCGDVMEVLLALKLDEAASELAQELYALRIEDGDEYGACRALEMGVRRAPRDANLFQKFVELLKQQQDFGRLAEVLVLTAEQSNSLSQASSQFAAAARVFETELGDPMQAAENNYKAYEKDPQQLELLGQSLEQFARVGEVDRALELLGQSIEQAHETDENMRRLELVARRGELIITERTESQPLLKIASTGFRELSTAFPDNSWPEKELQALFLERQLHQQLSDESSLRHVCLRMGSLQEGLGDMTGAIDSLATWLREHTSDQEVAQKLGELGLESGDYAAACFGFELSAEASQGMEKVTATLLFASAAEKSGDSLSARPLLEKCLKEHPDNSELKERLRGAFESAGAFAELAELLEEQLERVEEPEEQFKQLLEIADLRLKAEDAESARSAVERAKALGLDPYRIVAKLSQVHILLGDVAAAESVLDAGIVEHGKRRTPELALLQFGLSQVCHAKGDVEAMFTWLEAALMSDRNNGEVAAELARKAQEAERFESAIRALQVLSLRKTPGPIGKAEAYLRQAQIAVAQGDDKKGLLLAKRALGVEKGMTAAQELVASLN